VVVIEADHAYATGRATAAFLELAASLGWAAHREVALPGSGRIVVLTHPESTSR
jgi:hypothetical protein